MFFPCSSPSTELKETAFFFPLDSCSESQEKPKLVNPLKIIQVLSLGELLSVGFPSPDVCSPAERPRRKVTEEHKGARDHS